MQQVAEALAVSTGSVANYIKVAETGLPVGATTKIPARKKKTKALSPEEFSQLHKLQDARPPARDKIIIIETDDALGLLGRMLQ